VSGRGTPALAVLTAAGIAHVVHEYAVPETAGARDRDGRPHYGLDAAAALGVDPGRIFKTLVASVDGLLVVGVVPVSGELDLKALAAAAGGHRAELAPPEAAQRATGSVIGGISPLGHRRPMPVYVDSRASGFVTIFVSGGRRGLQVELAPGDLVRLAAATLTRIARER
jgi:Cys-tRNA(Pro)/Cys-tRNA(Cys) deacylase